MTDLNFIILAVYILCVTLVLFRIRRSFNDEFIVKPEKGDLTTQLETLHLTDIVAIDFKFEPRYEFDKLQKFAVKITNKSTDSDIYVDWDYCSITETKLKDQRARRVTRIIPGNTLDLFQNQAVTAVASGETLNEDITAESNLKRKGDNGPLEVTGVLFDLSPPNPKAPDAIKQLRRNFVDGKETLHFVLSLSLRLAGAGRPGGQRLPPIICKFTLIKLSWAAGLPFNPKK